MAYLPGFLRVDFEGLKVSGLPVADTRSSQCSVCRLLFRRSEMLEPCLRLPLCQQLLL